jgi:ribonucleotide reductase beta subunit family protein with ferritin-like domain
MKKYLIPVTERQEPINFAEQQLKIFWLPDEIKVEKDIQDILVNFSEAERHAAITTLKLFSLYETHAGDEYWGSRYTRIFDGAEFHRMAAVFSMFELAIHAPFYNKINELLNIDTPEFYLEYQKSPVLSERMKHISEIIDDEDDLVSLAGFSMVEGVILYSSFAFLKHYQSQGKNKLLNVVRGINFSVRDENIHAEAGAWSFRYKMSQTDLTEHEKQQVKQKVMHCAEKIYEHEKEIAKITFEKGKIDGITETQVVHFVQSRVNHCLGKLGYEKMFDVKYDPISSWFYKGINNYQFNDFFSGVGSQYHRNWDETAFVW